MITFSLKVVDGRQYVERAIIIEKNGGQVNEVCS